MHEKYQGKKSRRAEKLALENKMDSLLDSLMEKCRRAKSLFESINGEPTLSLDSVVEFAELSGLILDVTSEAIAVENGFDIEEVV